MENGIIDRSTDTSYPVSDRDGLRSDVIQQLLKRHHHHSALHCACGQDDGKFLALIPVLPSGAEELTVSRENIDEHSPECFLTLGSDGDDLRHLRASSILGPIPIRCNRDSGRADSDGHGRAHYNRFSTYARQIFSRGLGNAYIATNTGQPSHRNPTPSEVFSAIHEAIPALLFTDGVNGYTGAGRQGCRLRFGLVVEPFHDNDVLHTALNIWWWKNGSYSLALNAVRSVAMTPAVAAMKALQSYRKPPYFVFAVQGPDGILERIFFHQIALDESYLIPVDSGAEAAYAVSLIGKGAALIKPVRKEDMQSVLASFGAQLAGNASWVYRPDIVILWRYKRGLTLQVRELRGFAAGVEKQYDEHFAAKEVYYRGLQAGLPVEYKPEDGIGLVWNPPACGPDTWLRADLSFEGPSEGLLAAL